MSMRKTLIAVVAAVASIGVTAPGADAQILDAVSANGCTSNLLPGGVGGYDVSVAGRTFRVAKYEDFQVCFGTSGLTVHTNVVQQHAGCGATCFSVWGPVSALEPRVWVTECHTVDGSRLCSVGEYTAPIYMERPCYASVGKPAQHSPSQCLVVVDEDPALPLP